MKTTTLRACLAAALLASLTPLAHAFTPINLYTASPGSLPDNQGFLFHSAASVNPPTVTAPTTAPLAAELDTTATLTNQAGWATTQTTNMLNTTGYTLFFTSAVKSDDHSGNANRAGFDVIIISANDTKALELAFWPTKVFALNSDVPTFSTGESTLLDTTSLQNYALSVLGNNYTLYDNTTPILTGPLRDYTASTASVAGIPVYNVPGLIFLGDDTTSASADSLLQNVSLLQAAVTPEPTSLSLLALGATTLLKRRNRK